MLTEKQVQEILDHFSNQVQKHAALTALRLAEKMLMPEEEKDSGSEKDEDKD